MEFSLQAELVLSKTPKGVKLDDFVKSLGDILKKGAPDGKGAKIKDWKVSGDTIKLTINSGTYVRPHDAVFRIKNHLSRELGREHQLGVREVNGKRYEIKFNLEHKPKGEIRVPFVKSIDIRGKSCTIVLEDLYEEFLQKNYVDRIVNLVREKVEQQHYEGKGEHWELIWQSKPREPAWKEDPSRAMEDRNWIQHRGRGQWIFGPQASAIMRAMEQIIVDELLKPLKFDEMIVPKAVTWDVWQRSGHAKNLYPEIYYICPPETRDPEFWEDVIDLYKITGEVQTGLIKEKIKDPIGGVCYAQCPPFWPYLQGKTVSDGSLPVKVFDRSGTSMRYESGGIHGIERVDEFHRIELIWTGYPDEVKKIHQDIVERYKKIFNDILEFEWRMAWVTPWFMAQEGMIGTAEDKAVGTIDFEAYLPYRGPRKDSEWLEFQNASNNGDKYPKGFSVKGQKGELRSGCTGIGLERWLAVFIAQKGIDPEKWPKEFKKRIGRLPEGIGFL